MFKYEDQLVILKKKRKTRPSLALEHVAAVYLLERVYI